MLDHIAEIIRKYQMILPGEKVIVGVSGGVDSMSLLHILYKLQLNGSFTIIAAHIEHGIRGQESLEDAFFVEKFCSVYHIPFFLKRISVIDIAVDKKLSLEHAARLERYSFFNQVLLETKGQKIALAHHMNDQAETVLLHLLRGSGIKGLCGMTPIRDGKIIRPFLETMKSDILSYCHTEKIPYRMDQTNLQMEYTRNRVRMELIPYIEKYFNPSIVPTLARTAELLREEEDYLNKESLRWFEQLARDTEDGVLVSLSGLSNLHISLRRRCLRLAAEKLTGSMLDLEQKHIDDIMELVESGRTGAVLHLSGNIRVQKGYQDLVFFIGSPEKTFFCQTIDLHGKTIIPNIGILICSITEDIVDYRNERCRYIQYIDKDRLPALLQIRNRKEGDRIQPLGSSGSKKLKDYFIDRKIDRRSRDSIPLIADEHHVYWVIGYDLGDEIKVTSKTKIILRMEFILNDANTKEIKPQEVCENEFREEY